MVDLSKDKEIHSDLPALQERFDILFHEVFPVSFAGLKTYSVQEKSTGSQDFIAVIIPNNEPFCPDVLTRLINHKIKNLVQVYGFTPTDLPDGTKAFAVFFQKPAGRPLSEFIGQEWPESDVTNKVMRPIAEALSGIAELSLTHRAVSPENIFINQEKTEIILGPSWISLPASTQSALYEPAYSAVCEPWLRGEGSPADDIYALGVCLLALLSKEPLLSGMSEKEILHAKLENKNFSLLFPKNIRVSNALREILRSLLTEDPEYRPQASLLIGINPGTTRLIPQNDIRLIKDPYMLGGKEPIRSLTALACALGRAPTDVAYKALMSHTLNRWLRQDANVPDTAIKISEIMQNKSEFTTNRIPSREEQILLAITKIDPLAPVFWQQRAFWPSALRRALVKICFTDEQVFSPSKQEESEKNGEDKSLSSDKGAASLQKDQQGQESECNKKRRFLKNLILKNAPDIWKSTHRTGYQKQDPFFHDIPDHWANLLRKIAFPQFDFNRLAYETNPLFPCQTPDLIDKCVLDIKSFFSEAEYLAQKKTDDFLLKREQFFDEGSLAWLSARGRFLIQSEITALLNTKKGTLQRLLDEFKLVTAAQKNFNLPPLPGLLASFFKNYEKLAQIFSNRRTRQQVKEKFELILPTGDFKEAFALFNDHNRLSEDHYRAMLAVNKLNKIEQRKIKLQKPAFLNSYSIALYIGFFIFLFVLLENLWKLL